MIGNLSLALVTATMSFRIYKSVLAAVNKNQEGHPFKVGIYYLSETNILSGIRMGCGQNKDKCR